jgi:flagellar basal body-associated protein FliL
VSNDEDKDAKAEPKKSKLGLILGIVGGVVVLVAGGVTGLLLGPKMMGAPPAEAAPGGEAHGAPAPHAAPAPAHGEKPKGGGEHGEGHGGKVVSFKFDPIIVDVLSKFGESHHLKVGLAAELAEGAVEDDLKLVQPRGREAAITYLRALTYEEITNPKKYGKIKKDLVKKVTVAVGEERVSRVLVIDFVAQ